MNKSWVIIILLSVGVQSQTVLGKWKDYFSYFNVKDVIETEEYFICSTENGLFTYNKSTHELNKISKATGLHGVNISAVAYSANYQSLIVAYNNGSFDVIRPDGIEFFLDIPIDTDFQGNKAVNHLFIEGENVIFSMDFGITIFNLSRLEFDETTYFRNGSNFYIVNESLVINNSIIALTDNGIYTHEINDLVPNFNAWQHYFNGTPFQNAEFFNGTGFVSSYNSVYKTTDGAAYSAFASFNNLKDINAGLTHLSFITSNNLITYDGNLNSVGNQSFTYPLQTGISSGSDVYGGTPYNGLVLASTQEEIAPDGPYSNVSYQLTLFENQLYVAPGGRISFFAPSYNTFGYYHYNGTRWIHVPFSEINQQNIMEVAVHPLHPEQTFLASYGGEGMPYLENDLFQTLYNKYNSSIKGLPGLNQVRLVSNIFDSQGYLYAVESYSQVGILFNNLNIRSPDNQWVNIPLALPGTSTSHLLYDSKGWIWVGSPRTGGKLLGYDLKGTPMNTGDDEYYILSSGEGNGNLPSDEMVICIAEDLSGTLWIGTSQGIRIKTNPHNDLPNHNLDTQLIVIMQNGIPEEFLKDVTILDIAVDAANRKWIATRSGVFYVSPDGKTTLQFFNQDNSPIPINEITDIDIDPKTGIVYFVTPLGIVSYQGDFAEAGYEFGDIVVYPNPVRPGFTGNVVIKGLALNAKVKIVDLNGNLVFEDVAKGGALEWNQINLQGNQVASGIYIALMLNSDNTLSATAKFAIVR